MNTHQKLTKQNYKEFKEAESTFYRFKDMYLTKELILEYIVIYFDYFEANPNDDYTDDMEALENLFFEYDYLNQEISLDNRYNNILYTFFSDENERKYEVSGHNYGLHYVCGTLSFPAIFISELKKKVILYLIELYKRNSSVKKDLFKLGILKMILFNYNHLTFTRNKSNDEINVYDSLFGYMYKIKESDIDNKIYEIMYSSLCIAKEIEMQEASEDKIFPLSTKSLFIWDKKLCFISEDHIFQIPIEVFLRRIGEKSSLKPAFFKFHDYDLKFMQNNLLHYKCSREINLHHGIYTNQSYSIKIDLNNDLEVIEFSSEQSGTYNWR